jgi:hypothetical protein
MRGDIPSRMATNGHRNNRTLSGMGGRGNPGNVSTLHPRWRPTPFEVPRFLL